jgi:protein-glutamine gamma-glutamyltransferase
MSSRSATPLDRGGFVWSVAAGTLALPPIAQFLPPWLLGLCALMISIGIGLGLRRRTLPRALRVLITLAVVALILWDYGIAFGTRFGRDTGAAMLAAMLVLKVLELRTVRDARMLTSFGLFALVAAFLQDRGPLTLTLSLLATLVTFAALARIAETETPTRQLRVAGDWRERMRDAGRLALFSIPVALVAFFLFPRLASPLWGLPEVTREARTGLSDSMAPGDIAQLYADDSPMLRVSFDGAIPANADLYWRGPVLSQFDGRSWRRYFNAGSSTIPAADLDVEGPILSYEVQQEPTERHTVMALDVPVTAPDGMRLSLDRTLTSTQPLNEVSRHRLRSTTQYRFEPQLLHTFRQHMTALPDGFNPRAQALAREWRVRAGDDDRGVIEEALALFNAQFNYTLTTPLLGRHSVDEFLFDTRRGYCEHFASAFAVLMRAAGIPTRVVTGYQGGIRNPIGNYVLVRQSDAHAWNEVWLAGEGWVRVDPTNAVAPNRIDRGIQAVGGESKRYSSWGQPLFDTADWMRSGWNQFVLGFDAAQQRKLLRPFGIDDADWEQLGVALVVTLGIAILITLGLLLRRPQESSDPLVCAWRRFVRRMSKAGVSHPPHEGALDFAARAARALPGSAAQIDALSQRYVLQRYAAGVDRDEARRLCVDLRRFRIERRNA